MLLFLPNSTYAFDDIYMDAVEHVIEEIVEIEENERKMDNKDSIYNHSILLCAYGIDFSSPDSIKKYEIRFCKDLDLKKYVSTSSKDILRVFVLLPIAHCKTCGSPFMIRLVECHIGESQEDIVLLHNLVHTVFYGYNCNSNIFNYHHLATGSFDYYQTRDFVKKMNFKFRDDD